MRILVVSDTHRRASRLIDVMRKHQNADLLIHLGDGEEDLAFARYEFPTIAIRQVRGNCDFGSSLPITDTFSVDGVKIFFAHGHTYNVKTSSERIEAAAISNGAAVCLFGHTHCPITKYHDGLYVMNPGSLGHPRDGEPTYGLLDIVPAGISMNIVKY